jgi:molecular chaperone DnaK (HSP70)
VEAMPPEPVAVALGYALHKEPNYESKVVAVYDFGGSAFDFSILKTTEDGSFEVLFSNRDSFLGKV